MKSCGNKAVIWWLKIFWYFQLMMIVTSFTFLALVNFFFSVKIFFIVDWKVVAKKLWCVEWRYSDLLQLLMLIEDFLVFYNFWWWLSQVLFFWLWLNVFFQLKFCILLIDVLLRKSCYVLIEQFLVFFNCWWLSQNLKNCLK